MDLFNFDVTKPRTCKCWHCTRHNEIDNIDEMPEGAEKYQKLKDEYDLLFEYHAETYTELEIESLDQKEQIAALKAGNDECEREFKEASEAWLQVGKHNNDLKGENDNLSENLFVSNSAAVDLERENKKLTGVINSGIRLCDSIQNTHDGERMATLLREALSPANPQK